MEAEGSMVVARDLGGGRNGKLPFNGYQVSVMQDEKVLELCWATWGR